MLFLMEKHIEINMDFFNGLKLFFPTCPIIFDGIFDEHDLKMDDLGLPPWLRKPPYI